jgi:hypothetical protein
VNNLADRFDVNSPTHEFDLHSYVTKYFKDANPNLKERLEALQVKIEE